MVRPIVAGGDVVNLRRGLVVPGAPGLRAVDAYHGPLVCRKHHPIAVAWVDPHLVVVVSARRALDRHKGLAAIGGLIGSGIDDIGPVGVDRVHGDGFEIPAARPKARLAVDLAPVRAGVVRKKHAAGQGRHFAAPRGSNHGGRGDGSPDVIDDRPKAIWIAGRHGYPDLADEVVRRKAAAELCPGIAAVGGLVQAAAGQVGGGIHRPRRPPCAPQRGIDRLRMRRIKREIDRADIIRQRGVVQHLFPVRTTVHRAVHAARGVCVVHVSEGSDVDPVRVHRVHHNAADLAAVFEANRLPGLAGVGGFEDADAIRVLAANIRLACAHVDDVGISGCDGDGSNGADRDALVGNGEPGPPRIDGLPHTTADRSHVKRVGLARIAGDGIAAAAAHGTDVAPLQAAEKVGAILRRGGGRLRRHRARQSGQRESQHSKTPAKRQSTTYNSHSNS